MPETPTKGEQTEAGSRRSSRLEGAWVEGAIVGEHRLEAQLGRGGMGAVWSAVHLPTGARRALKTLLAHLGGEERVRFQREGEAQARVDAHRNVVRVHAAGVHAGIPWLAMDLVEGGDLRARLRGGPLSPDEAARIVRDLARGLAHVHRHGVLHRDLKPENVLFERDGTPRLVDFGVARLAGEAALTRTGEVIGTPAYMAPQQARGERVDERADVYGLGAVLYHALTGEPPFAGQTSLAVLTQVALERPIPPRRRRPSIPAALEAVCLAAMEPELSRRLASAEELVRALDRFLDPPAEPAPPRAVPWTLLLAAALSLGAALAALALRPPRPVEPDGAVVASGSAPPSSAALIPPPLSRPGELGRLLRRARRATPATRATLLARDPAAATALGAIARWEGWDGPAQPLPAQAELAALLRLPAGDPAREVALGWLRHAAALGAEEARLLLERARERIPDPLELDPRDLLGFDRSPVYDPGSLHEIQVLLRFQFGDAKTPADQRRQALRHNCARSQAALGLRAWNGEAEPGELTGRSVALRWFALGVLDAEPRLGRAIPFAWVRLGRSYLLGTDCEVDPEVAVHCLEEALAVESFMAPEPGRRVHALEARMLLVLAELEGLGRPTGPAAWADLGLFLCELQLAVPHELNELRGVLREARETGAPWGARAQASLDPILHELYLARTR